MKDFHDLSSLVGQFGFDGAILAHAIAETFARSKTDIPAAPPTGLTAEFYEANSKRQQWTAFTQRNRLHIERRELSEVVTAVAAFLLPVLESLSGARSFAAVRSPGGPWFANAEMKIGTMSLSAARSTGIAYTYISKSTLRLLFVAQPGPRICSSMESERSDGWQRHTDTDGGLSDVWGPQPSQI
jgi:hypothetical protein